MLQEHISKPERVTRVLAIGDTHFGTHNNSMRWLDKQLAYIDHLIELQDEYDVIIHMGDVFDSRHSLNIEVATRVKEAFSRFSKPLYIVCGNHDLYGPHSNTCTLDLIFPEHTIAKEPLDTPFGLLVPYNYQSEIPRLIREYQKPIYTHADCIVSSPYKVYNGHIHQPSASGNHYNLGSSYNLSFAEANIVSGAWIIGESIYQIPNNLSYRYWREYDINFDHASDDYIELYLDREYISQNLDIIKKLNKQYPNLSIIPTLAIKESQQTVHLDIEGIIQSLLSLPQQELLNKLKHENTESESK